MGISEDAGRSTDGRQRQPTDHIRGRHYIEDTGMTVEIQGFTELQKDLADRLWSLDTEAEIQEFVQALPGGLRREAWIVQQMITAAELDNYEEVSDAVKDYCRSL